MYVLTKALPQVLHEKKTNAAQSKAKCCICLETSPSVIYLYGTRISGALIVS